MGELLALVPRNGERLFAQDVDAPGKQLHTDRRVQVIGERQDHCVDTSHDLAIVLKRDWAEAIATPKVLQARGVQIAYCRQLDLGRGQHRRKMDAMPELEFGHVEQPQRVPGLDAMAVLEETQHFVDVVDPTFTRSPAGQDVTQGFGEDAGYPRVQRCGKAHLLNTISH